MNEVDIQYQDLESVYSPKLWSGSPSKWTGIPYTAKILVAGFMFCITTIQKLQKLGMERIFGRMLDSNIQSVIRPDIFQMSDIRPGIKFSVECRAEYPVVCLAPRPDIGQFDIRSIPSSEAMINVMWQSLDKKEAEPSRRFLPQFTMMVIIIQTNIWYLYIYICI